METGRCERMPGYIATILIEADDERDAEEQLQSEPLKFIRTASVKPYGSYTSVRQESAEPLSRLTHGRLFDRLVDLLNSLYGGDYYNRVSKIAQERGSEMVGSHFAHVDSASLQLLIEVIESQQGSPELKDARIIAEEVLRIVSQQESHAAEDMREFIGRELDLSDAAILEAWETIEQNRIKKEVATDVQQK